ncbi:MAG: Eco57I restriction-modification methylase domain-containing protein [Candidatus Limisoma sp.]
MTFESALKPKLIYVFRINDEAHSGCLKIGEATLPDGTNIAELAPNSRALNRAAKDRIDQYTRTAGIDYELLHTEVTLNISGRAYKSFNDKEVHQVLLRSGIRRRDSAGWGTEWFETDLPTVINAINAVKEGRSSLTATEISKDRNPIAFRPEQREAIDKTVKKFRKGKQMLWNAKMRFGKTLSALQVVKEMNFRRTLILTHRPILVDGWYEDFQKIFYDRPDFGYGSKKCGESFATLEAGAGDETRRYIYFASIQDLRGSETVGGKFDKNNEIFSTPWNLLIIDEAHEGTQTELGKNVINELEKKATKTLSLSGTPFNLFDNYKEDELYTWDYVMEQKAKAQWDLDHFGDPNPYAGLPTMNIFTYDLGRLLKEYADSDVAFNFREFFRVNDSGEFVHHKDVAAFLDLLCKKGTASAYPFSTDAYRDNFRHTLWMVPGVKSALALQRMLNDHPVFEHFDVVNVAGEGDPTEEENAEALEKLRKAIGNDPDLTRTITLSCGRLTTGVSVKEWTAVLMLSGSFNTAAAGYLQTIFRVQTPATINGRVKEQCYVFDFAPDRTLKVLAEAAKVQTKPGSTSTDKEDKDNRRAMGDFLNFCPVISIEGSTMRYYDVDTMMQQLKKVYIERVVNHGFEDIYLYTNKKLENLDSDAVEAFEGLRKIIGQTKQKPQTDTVDVNNQGVTGGETETGNSEPGNGDSKPGTGKPKPEPDPEIIRKRKLRDTAISILRGISIRMPLMIYGADIDDETQEITIDNFTSLIDPLSWEEFMPRGVTKQRFNAFRKYYDPDVFAASAKRIREMVRSADRLSIEQRIERITQIFATFRNPDKETVLTPWRVVNMHISDTIGGYTFFDADFDEKKPLSEPRFVDRGKVTADVFNRDTRILEINSKTGLYPLYMAYSAYRARLDEIGYKPESIDDEWAVWSNVVAENIFVICKTPMAKSITRRTLVGFRGLKVNTQYFEDLINQIKTKPDNFVKKVAKGKTFWKAINNDNMKFNAVVGNPPYQVVNERTSDMPVYHLFIDIAAKLSKISSLITPARYLFNAGKTPADWNKKILHDTYFNVVKYTANSSDIFPNVDIKGGVAYYIRNEDHDCGPIITYSSYKELNGILSKVAKIAEESIASIIYAQNKFKLDLLVQKYPNVKQYIGSEGKEKRLTTSIFSLDGVFYESKKSETDIQILGLVDNKRQWRWIESNLIEEHPNLLKYKVIVPKSNGSGAIGEVLSTPLIGEPLIGVTQSFITFGAFNNIDEASACLKYVKTKFARCLLGTLKVTQHNPKETWANVPLQDFTEKSDIDWSKSVEDIDRQLYAKYRLNDEEIAFIESMIKPM